MINQFKPKQKVFIAFEGAQSHLRSRHARTKAQKELKKRPEKETEYSFQQSWTEFLIMIQEDLKSALNCYDVQIRFANDYSEDIKIDIVSFEPS